MLDTTIQNRDHRVNSNYTKCNEVSKQCRARLVKSFSSNGHEEDVTSALFQNPLNCLNMPSLQYKALEYWVKYAVILFSIEWNNIYSTHSIYIFIIQIYNQHFFYLDLMIYIIIFSFLRRQCNYSAYLFWTRLSSLGLGTDCKVTWLTTTTELRKKTSTYRQSRLKCSLFHQLVEK